MAKPLFTGPEVICVPTAWDGSEGEPYGSEGGRALGNEVLEMIAEALALRAEVSRVRALGECVRRFPRETLRHPEVHLYLEHLARRGNTAALTRILADRPRRGRPARSVEEVFTETAILEGILAREGGSVSNAARIARRDHPHIFGHKSVRSIENDFSLNRDAYRVASQPRWVPGDRLTDEAWISPEQRRRQR